MKKIFGLLIVLVSAGCSLGKTYTATSPGWAEEEAVLLQALEIRAQKISQASPFRIEPGWIQKISLESLGNNIIVKYIAETRALQFTNLLNDYVEMKYQTPLKRLDPAILAQDNGFGEITDHELGHLLMDQLSRQMGYGPCFTVEHYKTLTDEKKLGLNIVTEGVGLYFQRINFSRDEFLLVTTLPASIDDPVGYTYGIIAFYGGLWLVKDILNLYGEPGLKWLISHPFVPDLGNLRASAIEYRRRALEELGQP